MVVIAKGLFSESNLILLSGLMLLGAAAYKIGDLFDEPGREVSTITRTKVETAAVSTTKKASSHTTAVLERPTEPSFLLLDINSATADELTQLSGIGEHLAAEIVAYREEHGRFLNVDELTKVSGIGEATLADIREHVYVTDPVYTTEVQTEKPTEPHTEPPEVVEVTEPPLTLEDVAPVDLNSADLETLILLPNVSEETAEEIIELRRKLGGFRSYYELLYVDSLTQKEVSEIAEYVFVEEKTENNE